MDEDRRCARPVCARRANGLDGQSLLKGQLPEKLGGIHCISPRITCPPVWEPNQRMQAPPALTSQRRNVGPIETEEITGRAKIGQSVPFFEFGMDAHEDLASICPVGFRRMPNHGDRHAKFLKPCVLAARNLQSAAEGTPRFATSSEAEENFAAKAMYGGQRLFFATCLGPGRGLVE